MFKVLAIVEILRYPGHGLSSPESHLKATLIVFDLNFSLQLPTLKIRSSIVHSFIHPFTFKVFSGEFIYEGYILYLVTSGLYRKDGATSCSNSNW